VTRRRKPIGSIQHVLTRPTFVVHAKSILLEIAKMLHCVGWPSGVKNTIDIYLHPGMALFQKKYEPNLADSLSNWLINAIRPSQFNRAIRELSNSMEVHSFAE
jgi:hypothetical protein